MGFYLEKPDDIEKGWGYCGTMPLLDMSTFIPEGDHSLMTDIDLDRGVPIGTTEDRLMIQNWMRKSAVDYYRGGRYLESFRWFKKCFLKYRDPRSITCLGFLFEHGKGIRMNRKKAMTCYKLGDKFGDPYGTKMVSWGYLWGLDDLPNLEKSCWYNAKVKYLPYLNIKYETGW